MRGDPPVVNFNGGEVSPLMYGRTDYAKYSSSAQFCENFIPSILGPLRRRPGTQYVGNPKNNAFAAEDIVLIPFVASTANEFVLEVGSGYMRFWDASTRKQINNNGTVWGTSVAGPAAELATPWLTADLYTRDEHNNINGVGLAWAQSNDVMWISAGNWPTVKLKRIAQYQFSFSFMGDGFNIPTPFDDLDPLNAITVTASGFTGVGITLTASSALFTAADVNTYIYLEQPAVDSLPQWEAAKAGIVIGNRVRSNGRNYIALTNGTTGTSPPSHSSGSRYDGTTGVQWRWTDDGYGVAAITALTDSTHVTATVNFELPGTLVTAATTRWSRQAWRAANGFPTAVAFFRQRLCFGRGNTIWTSVNSDFENFTRKQAGQVTLDMSFVGTLAADKNDKVLWLYGDTALLAGTASGEWAIGEQASAQPFGPGNAKAEKQSGYGAIAQPPIKVDTSLLYMQRGGNRLREFEFDALAGVSGKWKSTDRSQLAEHMAPQYGYLTAVHQRQPESVVWVASASGRLYSMTYDKAQNVYAWARHRLGGFGVLGNGPIVAAMCSVKSPDGVNDDVWMLVHRFDSGFPNTTLEVLGPAAGIFELGRYAFHDIAFTQDANYLDCSATVTVGASASAIVVNPLQIVSGTTVAALINGCVEADAPIAAGGSSYPINPTADIRPARIGYRYTSNYWSLSLPGQSATGTSQGKIARVWKGELRVYNSVGFLFGITPTDAVIDRKEFRTQDMTMNDPVPLRSGDFALSPNTAYVRQPTVFVQQDQPLPLNLLAIFPKLFVEDSA